MRQPAAKQGDQITGMDNHIVLVSSGSGPVPTMLPHPFNGIIDGGLSSNVKIMGRPAATVGSTASNTPPHIPMQPGTFHNTPTNKGTIKMGSQTVKINGKAAARNQDMAETCNDPVDALVGTVKAAGTVFIG